MSLGIGILIALLGLLILIWLGLKIKPKAFGAFPYPTPDLETIPLRADLPGPVGRFYRKIFGDQIPLIESAVISGKAKLRLFGITFPGRFRFTHIARQNYRHYIEATLFGLPIMKVNEHYIDGKSRLELPFGIVENEPNVDQAANLGLWGESIWLPSILLTDPRIRWQLVDADTALLTIPFGEVEQTFVARFDRQSGMLRFLEAMRYKDAADEVKTLWINEALDWGELNGWKLPTVGAVTWLDEGTPWAVFTVEEVVYNVDVGEYIHQRGP